MMNLLGLALSLTAYHCLHTALVLLIYLMLHVNRLKVCVGMTVIKEYLVISVTNLLNNCNVLW